MSGERQKVRDGCQSCKASSDRSIGIGERTYYYRRAARLPNPRLLDALSCRDLGSDGTENRFKGLDSSNFGLELNFRPCSGPGRRSITEMEQLASDM